MVMFHCRAREQGWENDGSLQDCTLKLRVAFEVGHVFGMSEAINGQSVPLESPRSILEYHIQPRVAARGWNRLAQFV